MANEKQSSPVLIGLAWLVVSIPLAWGLYRTSLNAAKLFQSTPASVSPAAAGVLGK